MTANINALYPLTPNIKVAVIGTGVTTLTVTGVTGLTLLFTAGANGSRLDSITAQATGTTTAGMLRYWYYVGSGNATLWEEDLVSALTPSATVQAFFKETMPTNWVIPNGSSIYVSTHNSEAFAITARGGDF